MGEQLRIIVVPDDGLDDDMKQLLRLKFESDEGCRWCGGLHQRECPRVKHIVFHPNDERSVREVEFWHDGEWDKSSIIWPEDCV